MFRISPKDLLLLTAILIAGLALRLYHLDTYSVFFDEKSTLVVSQGMVLEGSNQKDIFTAATFTPEQFWSKKTLADYFEAMTRSDIGNSAFYYLLLHYWLEIFGISDFTVRLFSVVFSVLIIGMTYLFGRRYFSSNTGLIAAAIVAIEPFFIAYSHQARNYSLTFFLTLLATYLFLRLIEDKPRYPATLGLYLAYGITAGLGLLSHFLVIAVLIAHGLYALLFLRRMDGWIKMAVAAAVALSGVTWWMVAGGGQWTLRTLQYQAELYKKMAETGDHTYGVVLPATFKNVFIKSLPLFSDLVLFTNGLSDVLEGRKNVIIAISLGIFLVIWYRYRHRISFPDWAKFALPAALLLAAAAFYSNHKMQFTILSVSIFALSFVYEIHKSADHTQRKRLWLLYVMGLVPTLFLIAMSFKNGHTYGITQRYSGFSFPYVIILLSLLLQHFNNLQLPWKVLVFVVLSCQMYFVGQRLQEFYQDRSLKYGYFAEPRPANPFFAAARKIREMYQPGDTIVYPAKRYEIKTEMDRTFLPYSVRDAQLTNLYLPKDAQYIQRIDPSQADRILIRRKGQSLEIMNLKGQRAGDD